MRSPLLCASFALFSLLQGSAMLGGQASGSAGHADQIAGPGAGYRSESTAELRRAAEAGDLLAENNLGAAYALGRGVERSNEEAARWFALAAKSGYAPAESNLGYLYEKGLGVGQDYAAALGQYRAAAESGNAQAQVRIGLFYENGWGGGGGEGGSGRGGRPGG